MVELDRGRVLLLIVTTLVSTAVADERPNVILVTVDTFRPDHIGYYGYRQETSPHLDTFSGEGVFFKQAFTTSAWTTPGLISILISLYAPTHAVDVRGVQLDPGVETLPEVLGAAGYVVPDIFFLTDLPNFSNLGFETYVDRDRYIHQNDDILFRWLEREANDQTPHFLYYHYRDLHQPYNPGADYEEMFVPAAFSRSFGFWAEIIRFIARDKMEVVKSQVMLPRGTMDFGPRDRPWVEALYDGGIRRMDEEFFGRLYRYLADQRSTRPTLVIVSADHGEELLDHGLIGHVSTFKEGRLYDEIARIPLILWLPGTLPAGRVIDDPVQCIDIMPTVLDLIGLPATGQEQGRSLMPLIEERGDWPVRPVYLETTGGGYTADSVQYAQRFRAIRSERWKLVYGSPTDSYQLFDLLKDPGELEDVQLTYSGVADSLKRLLNQWSIYTHRRPFLQPQGEFPLDPMVHGGGAPSVLSPMDGDTLHYQGANFSIEPSWTGRTNDYYVIKYEVGRGAYHLRGELEETTSTPKYGPFQSNFWNSLVLYNPWRFRVYRKADPQVKSEWITFHLAPSDSSSATTAFPLLVQVVPALEAVVGHGVNIGIGLTLALVDLALVAAEVSPADLSAYLLIAVILSAILWPRVRRLGIERCRKWGLAIAYVGFVYCTVPLMPKVWAALSMHTQGSIGYAGILAVIVIGLILLVGVVRRVGASSWIPYVALGLIAVAYGHLLMTYSQFPAERLHLVEYGFVGFLLNRALRLDVGRNRAYALAFCLTVLIGVGDELIQLLLPQRFFEMKDIQLNALSGGLGLVLWRVVERY